MPVGPMPGECRMLIGLDLGDRSAQKRPDNRSSHHAFHPLIGHEPEEETKQERRRDIEVPPAELPLVIESPRNVGLGFHWASSSDWLRAESPYTIGRTAPMIAPAMTRPTAAKIARPR